MPTAAKYQSAAPLATSKVDAEAGIIRDVALVSIGEASGHETRIDQKTLEMFYALVSGQTVKAFINHSDNPKPTEAVGIYSGFYIDVAAGVLRASQFQAFKAFRENDAQAYETLFEMAATAPDAFGVSANFFLELEEATDGGHPFARPTHVESFDIVCTPAANRAFFSKKPENEKTVDTTPDNGKASSVVETQSHLNKKSPISKMKQIYAKFSANPKALTRACQLAAEMPEDTKEEVIIDKVEEEIDAEAYAAVIAENAALKAKVAEFEAKVAEQEPKVAEAAALSTKVTELTEQVAKLSKARGRFGAAPINTGKDAGKEPVTITRAQFNALSHPERETHMKSGGKITD